MVAGSPAHGNAVQQLNAQRSGMAEAAANEATGSAVLVATDQPAAQPRLTTEELPVMRAATSLSLPPVTVRPAIGAGVKRSEQGDAGPRAVEADALADAAAPDPATGAQQLGQLPMRSVFTPRLRTRVMSPSCHCQAGGHCRRWPERECIPPCASHQLEGQHIAGPATCVH